MNWLKEHWKPVAGAALCLVCFAFGRYSVPAPDVKVDDRIASVTQSWAKTVYLRDTEVKRVVIRDTTKLPDGTVKEHEEEHEDTKVSEKTNADVNAVTKVTEAEKVSVESSKPQWIVSVLGGAQVALGPQPSASLAFGASVQHRLVGPVFVGAWGLSTGAVGAAISLEF
jgi:hypothetical protein